jgi:5'-3' exonuclease
MGIPSYFSYIIKNYSNIIRTLESVKGEHNVIQDLYMDCNSIIYDAFHSLSKCENNIKIEDIESMIITSVLDKIVHYIELIRPSDTVFIAFDGVAPFAKMDQQRNRRYKSMMLSKISLVELSNEPEWSTSNITPGTNFMHTLGERVTQFFVAYSKSHPETKNIIVSTSTDPGEGEHKMFCYMRNRYSDCKTKASKDTIAVYGLDSDLIMLSIFHCKLVKNIYIFRETPEFAKSLVNTSSLATNAECSFMDISRLSWGILHELQCNGINDHRIYDYVFLCFFLGNDFLPHFPSLNLRTSGMNTLLTVYRKTIGSFPNRYFISNPDLEIQWNWVQIFIKELVKNEHELILNEYDVREKWAKRKWSLETKEDRDFCIQSIPVIYRSEEVFICPREKHWQHRYYQCLFHEEYDIESICMNYIEGLEWVFYYYTRGCIHWQWKYKYAYPPLLSDLATSISKQAGVYSTRRFIDSSVSNNRPFSSNVQLSYVLPKTNHNLLPSKIMEVLQSPEYSVFFPDDVSYKWPFCRYLWEAHADLPEIGVDVLQTWGNLFDLVV